MPRVSREACSLCIPTAQVVVGGVQGPGRDFADFCDHIQGALGYSHRSRGGGTRGRDGEVSYGWVGKNWETQCMTLQLR